MHADILDFFPSIDHRLLLQDIQRTLDDRDLLRLIGQWLDAGVLDARRAADKATSNWRSPLAGIQLAARDTIGSLADEFLSQRLDVPRNSIPLDSPEAESDFQKGRSPIGRAIASRVLEDGLLFALANRLILRKAFTARILGLGGAALALTAAAPPVIRKLRELLAHPAGALQGAPISPLLSNIYLHPVDLTLAAGRFRLLRYCDDFIILSRSDAEGREALQAAETALKERRLRLNMEKSAIVPPSQAFNYLGYHFLPDGRVVSPPGIPEVMARRIADFAGRAMARVSARKGRKS